MKDKIKVLVVEDEALTALMLCSELSRHGYDVYNNASSAEDAIRYASEKNPDIIFMDIRLNGIKDGIDAAEKIISDQNIPIAFMTGYPSKELKERASRLKPVAFLNKPVRIDELKNLIEKEALRG